MPVNTLSTCRQTHGCTLRSAPPSSRAQLCNRSCSNKLNIQDTTVRRAGHITAHLQLQKPPLLPAASLPLPLPLLSSPLPFSLSAQQARQEAHDARQSRHTTQRECGRVGDMRHGTPHNRRTDVMRALDQTRCLPRAVYLSVCLLLLLPSSTSSSRSTSQFTALAFNKPSSSSSSSSSSSNTVTQLAGSQAHAARMQV